MSDDRLDNALKILDGMVESLQELERSVKGRGYVIDAVNGLKLASALIKANIPADIVLRTYHNSLCQDLGRPDLMRKD